MEQYSVEKALKLIGYLSGDNGYTVRQLASFLRTTTRTIYRYLDTFEFCGYVVHKNKKTVYSIAGDESLPDFSKLVMFSTEEAYILDQLLDMLVNSNPLKAELRRKLSVVSGTVEKMRYTIVQEQARNIEIIGEAIRNKQKVIFKAYQSTHSKTTRDREVEPYHFTEDFIYVFAYDIESQSCKMFKVSRIGSVSPMICPWEHEDKHDDMCIDVFRMPGIPKYKVTLILSLRAKRLLIEDYPLSGKYISWYSKGHWRFHTTVCELEGVGRFVLGLPSDVKIIGSDELKDYVHKMATLSLSNHCK